KTNLEESRAAKEITFVLDTSGSMSGEKLDQAKRALKFALDHLNRNDRFNLISFSGDVELFRPHLVDATPESVAAARRFVEELQARGGTNIHDALLAALKQQSPRRGVPAMILFLTDGLPTVGVTDLKEILSNVNKTRVEGLRLFVFGVGDDVNTYLLDRLSGENGGVSEYVRPGEDLEVKVSSFYTKIATPALSNLELDYGGAEVYDVYPKRLPDLFAGTQVLVTGRYRKPGRFTLTLRGSVGGEPRRFTYPADFSGEDRGTSFIPRIWATRKVGYLLDELRLHGHNQELVDEVTRLGMEYGIVTPYTSALVEEDRRPGPRPYPPPVPLGGPAPFGGAAQEAAKSTGSGAVDVAVRLREAKEAGQVRDEGGMVRHVEGKTFSLRGDTWVDVQYRPEMRAREVRFASDEYFALMQRQPKLARWFALGERVLVVWQGEAIKVIPAD
ncbi:MAG: VWA domain-containing protein, partial [Armatimonadota bacterium]|nr:VWA domain-containing protein [Armatimonadota bacterium]